MWWFLFALIFAVGYSLFSRYRLKQYKESGAKDEDTHLLKEEIYQKLAQNNIDMTDKKVLNGHYIKQVSHLWRTTTYYSFLITFSVRDPQIDLFSYIPEENSILPIGTFRPEQIKVHNEKDYSYNFMFHADSGKLITHAGSGKRIASVQVYRDTLPFETEYQIQYPQSEELDLFLSKIKGAIL